MATTVPDRRALVAEAIKAYLAVDALSEEELRYVHGYLLHPEDTAGARAIAEASSWRTWNQKNDAHPVAGHECAAKPPRDLEGFARVTPPSPRRGRGPG